MASASIRDKMNARFIAYSTVVFSLTLALSGFMPFLQHMSAANSGTLQLI